MNAVWLRRRRTLSVDGIANDEPNFLGISDKTMVRVVVSGTVYSCK